MEHIPRLDTALLASLQKQVDKRVYELRTRELAVFDYEKVLFNSGYQLGIIGLLWIATRMSYLFQAISEIPDIVADILDPGDIGEPTYRTLWDWIEGSKKDVDVNKIPNSFARILVRGWRVDPNAFLSGTTWTTLKTYYSGSDTVDSTGKPLEPPILVLMKSFDKLFNQYGGYIPYLVLGFNLANEKRRVARAGVIT